MAPKRAKISNFGNSKLIDPRCHFFLSGCLMTPLGPDWYHPYENRNWGRLEPAAGGRQRSIYQRAGVVALFLDVTDGRTGGVLREHLLRMCAWLGKPDCSRQRPAD